MKKKQNHHWERYREIGFQISYYRKHMQMTQEALAEKLDVSRQHIGAIEAPNVNRKISMDLLFDIADLFGVEPKYFLEYRDIPNQKRNRDGVQKSKKKC